LGERTGSKIGLIRSAVIPSEAPTMTIKQTARNRRKL
jgi:hypothetical protein